MNATISRILVPVDFSPHSDLALDYATTLAGRLGASLHVLHVVEPVSAPVGGGELYMPDLSEFHASLVADAERRMEDCRAHASAAGVPATTGVFLGQTATTIASTATEKECDLIVMGTHGRTGLGHLFLGSVAEKVTRLAPCAVLTVRETAWRKGERKSGVAAAA